MSAKPSVVIGALGAASVLWASALAFRQQRLRLLVGYSSIAQLGYVFLVLPINTSAAVVGGAYQLVSHACAAAAMFLAVDAIERAAGHDDVDRLHGLAHHIPLTFVAFGLAGASAIGLPPSGGFIAKWLLLRAALDLGEWWWATVPLIGGLMTAAYVFRVLRGAFLPAPVASRSPVPRGRQVIALSLALIALALGLAPSIPLGLLAEGMRS